MNPNNHPYIPTFQQWLQIHYSSMLGTVDSSARLIYPVPSPNPSTIPPFFPSPNPSTTPPFFPSPNPIPTPPSVSSLNPTLTIRSVSSVPPPSIPSDPISNTTTPAPSSTTAALNQAIDKKYPELSIATLHYTEKQSRRLFTAYQTDKTPDSDKMTDLAQNIGLTKRQVEQWFCVKRASLAKAENEGRLEEETERLATLHNTLQRRKRIRAAAKKAKSAANEGDEDLKNVDEFIPTPIRTNLRKSTDTQGILYGVYQTDKFPSFEKRRQLAETLGLNNKQVYEWFRTRNPRLAREKKEENSAAHKPSLNDQVTLIEYIQRMVAEGHASSEAMGSAKTEENNNKVVEDMAYLVSNEEEEEEEINVVD